MSDCTTFIPHLVVGNAAAAIEFYKHAFGAEELARVPAPNSNKLMHAMLAVNGGRLILNDDFSAEMGEKPSTPEALGGSPVTLHMQVQDANAAWQRALEAGSSGLWPLVSGSTTAG